ncbi:MAG TPA: hypothetical protein VFQ45_09290 [Longimicrobium sp.]|nr:hypothetical protein [Longimicrobium sp.]
MADSAREIPYPDVDIAAVRRHANLRANATSARQVAEQVGIRHQSLQKFLDGAQPYARNRGLLCEWYLRERPARPAAPAEGAGAPPPHDPEACIDVLLRELRGEARSEARQRISNAIAQGYRRMGLPEPHWL